ncbi:hypothetical protein KFU94_02030 [Chloroflexi bacterium TSY]|nr:hypothetical protein [Chloroflexi bacterium TSY]
MTELTEQQRPDLGGTAPNVVAYIEALEAELVQLRAAQSSRRAPRSEAPLEPSEPPTTMNVISISKGGVAKRTRHHFYPRQRRGGMGIFDLESAEDDPPAFVVVADESAGLVVVTNQARAFRLPVLSITSTEVRGRGEPILADLPLRPDEHLAVAFADQGGSNLALVSERGQVRKIAARYLGGGLQQGTVLYNPQEGGPPAAACWTPGDADLFLMTRLGKAIRFQEKQVPVRGCLGMRVDREDESIGVAAAPADGGAFIVTNEGKGTIRLMSGFNANKSPGAGGKVGMKAEKVIGAATVTDNSDIFLISQLGKMIRFQAADVPPKEGVVQGVNCMNLRADECVAMAVCEL